MSLPGQAPHELSRLGELAADDNEGTGAVPALWGVWAPQGPRRVAICTRSRFTILATRTASASI